MRFEDVADAMALLVDEPEALDPAVVAFVESDLRSQAELARYRKLVRSLRRLRSVHVEPPAGLLAETLAAIESTPPGSRRITRHRVTTKRVAFVGALGGVAAGAAATAVVVTRRRMSPAGSVG